MRLKNAVVLVTGASSGIGEATALAFARAHCRLALCARRLDRLQAVAQRCRSAGAAAVITRRADVGREAEAQAFVAAALRDFEQVDVLVNNAGRGWSGRFQETPLERAREMVEHYVATLDPYDEPLGVERTVATRSDVIAVSGRIDRLDSRPSRDPESERSSERSSDTELVVVDYKTGRHLLTTDDARGSMALAIYALAASRVLRRPCHRVELHHLPTGEVIGWDHTDESLARQLRRAEDIALECADADERFAKGEEGDQVFPPRPSPACGWCDYLRHCPEGAAAAIRRRPWDGLSAD